MYDSMARTVIGEVSVSTIRISSGYEVMVFGGKYNKFKKKRSVVKEALRLHNLMVEKVKSELNTRQRVIDGNKY